MGAGARPIWGGEQHEERHAGRAVSLGGREE